MNYQDIMNLGQILSGGIISGQGAFPQQNNGGRGIPTVYTPMKPQTAAQTAATSLAPQQTPASAPAATLAPTAPANVDMYGNTLPQGVYTAPNVPVKGIQEDANPGNPMSYQKMVNNSINASDPTQDMRYYYTPNQLPAGYKPYVQDDSGRTLNDAHADLTKSYLYSDTPQDVQGYTRQDPREGQGILSSVWPAAIPIALAALGPMGAGLWSGTAAGTAAPAAAGAAEAATLAPSAAAGAPVAAETAAGTYLPLSAYAPATADALTTGVGPMYAGEVAAGAYPTYGVAASSPSIWSNIAKTVGLSGGAGSSGLDVKKLLATMMLANGVGGLISGSGSSNPTIPGVTDTPVHNVPRTTHYNR